MIEIKRNGLFLKWKKIDYKQSNIKQRSAIATKIRDCNGDSIVEVLVALLISALGIVMLAGMISASMKLVTKSKDIMHDYIKAGNELIKSSSTEEALSGKVTMKISGLSAEPDTFRISENIESQKDISVTYYINSTIGSSPVAAYKVGGGSS